MGLSVLVEPGREPDRMLQSEPSQLDPQARQLGQRPRR